MGLMVPLSRFPLSTFSSPLRVLFFALLRQQSHCTGLSLTSCPAAGAAGRTGPRCTEPLSRRSLTTRPPYRPRVHRARRLQQLTSASIVSVAYDYLLPKQRTPIISKQQSCQSSRGSTLSSRSHICSNTSQYGLSLSLSLNISVAEKSCGMIWPSFAQSAAIFS